MKKQNVYLLMSLSFSMLFANAAQAGTTTSYNGIFGSASGVSALFSTPDTNNDNSATASPNPVDIGMMLDHLGPVDLTFSSTTSSGTTEYYTTASLQNNSGTPWIGFEIILGFGNQTAANFVQSLGNDFFDHDTPERDPTPTYTGYSLFNHGANVLTWAGGTIDLGHSFETTFSFDIPDDNSFIPGFAKTTSGFDYTIRFNPIGDPSYVPPSLTTIPEPSTLFFLGLGLFLAPFVSKKFSRK